MNESVKGQIALVTGASRGIGRAIAAALAGQGATVIGTATREAGAAAISEALAAQGGRGIVLDVNDGAEKRELEAFIEAYAKGGQLVGEFTSQNQALDKAFELCPES